MSDGTDWVLRPVSRGLCQYESLVNGALSLEDISRLNEMLDVEDENLRRYKKHASSSSP